MGHCPSLPSSHGRAAERWLLSGGGGMFRAGSLLLLTDDVIKNELRFIEIRWCQDESGVFSSRLALLMRFWNWNDMHVFSVPVSACRKPKECLASRFCKVKFDSDAYEMKCWYRDLRILECHAQDLGPQQLLEIAKSRKPKNPEDVKMPDWVEDCPSSDEPPQLEFHCLLEDWWPEEPAPEPDYVGNESDPELNFVIKGPFPKARMASKILMRTQRHRAWVLKLFEDLEHQLEHFEHLELRDAYEITEEERQQDAERWAEFRVSSRFWGQKEAERKKMEQERRKAFEESERKWAEEEARKKKSEESKVKKVKVRDPEEEDDEEEEDEAGKICSRKQLSMELKKLETVFHWVSPTQPRRRKKNR
eukprot:Skav202520  [mRNA]  locus=scaffold2011:11564:14533:- [translate_table: standard]